MSERITLPIAGLPVLNTGLLSDLLTWAVLDQVRLDQIDPEERGRFQGWGSWDQTYWAKELRNGACRSSYCQAGQAVLQAGYVLEYRQTDRVNGKAVMMADFCYEGEKSVDTKGRIIMVARPGAPRREIWDVAREVLGLTQIEEDLYFSGNNDLEDLWSYAKAMCMVRGLDPDTALTMHRSVREYLDELLADRGHSSQEWLTPTGKPTQVLLKEYLASW